MSKFKVFGFKSDTACSHTSQLFSFALPRSSSLCLLFLIPLFFSFAGYFLGFISDERFFGRLLGL